MKKNLSMAYSARLKSGPRINASVFSSLLWPTPRGTDGPSGGPNQHNDRGEPTLPNSAAHWQTPKGSDGYNGGPNQRSGQGQPYLPAQAAHWPTPNVPNGGRGLVKGSDLEAQTRPDGSKLQVMLHHAAESWPTPRVASERSSRAALLRPDGHWSAVGLSQMVELAMGELPREFNSIEELTPQAKAAYEMGQNWPTPDAALMNDGEEPEHFAARKKAIRDSGSYDNGNGAGTPLAMAVKEDWPTPSAAAAKQGQNDPDGRRGQTLIGAARGQDWPTPRASPNENRNTQRAPSHGNSHGSTLAGEAAEFDTWPTPRTSDYKSGEVSGEVYDSNSRPLTEVAARWPTPTKADGQGAADIPGGQNRRTPPLREAATHWPTPMAGDSERTAGLMARGNPTLSTATTSFHPSPQDATPITGALSSASGPSLHQPWSTPVGPAPHDSEISAGRGRPNRESYGNELATQATAMMPEPIKRRLNPRFEAWLMGLIPGWLEERSSFGPEAMASYLLKQRSLLAYLLHAQAYRFPIRCGAAPMISRDGDTTIIQGDVRVSYRETRVVEVDTFGDALLALDQPAPVSFLDDEVALVEVAEEVQRRKQKVYLGPGETVEWGTPDDLFSAIERAYGPFWVDPAATSQNARAPIFYTQHDNGLTLPWDGMGTVWCNPPYGRRIGDWVRRGADTADLGTRVVMLLPANMDTEWYQSHVLARADTIWFVKGRIKFVGNNGQASEGATFGSCVVVYEPKNRRSSTVRIGRITRKGTVIIDPRLTATRGD